MTRSAAAESELTRLMTTVAWLYHSRQLRQGAIAERLRISQSRVSRLLDQAAAMGIVQTVVVLPSTAASELEAGLESAYGLTEAHVYDLGDTAGNADLTSELGQLLALHLQSVPPDEEIIGFTSWSRTLQETVRHLRPLPHDTTKFVVEMLGDLGPPVMQHEAAQTTRRLADLTGATPVFLRTPGVLTKPDIGRELLAHDPHAQAAIAMHDEIQLALVGVGAADIADTIQGGDNFLTAEQFQYARSQGAVGEVNLRFLDAEGRPIRTELDDLVVGARLEQLSRARRRMAVAGGPRKYQAIRAALRGGWINSLLTDAQTARFLLDAR